jgi:hypothetical protein
MERLRFLENFFDKESAVTSISDTLLYPFGYLWLSQVKHTPADKKEKKA